MCALGGNADESMRAGRQFRHAMRVVGCASALGNYRGMSPNDALAAEPCARSEAGALAAVGTAPFRGEIALVTGGASGIGKACVESLLSRGAAVVNLDISPAVETIFEGPDYLGVRCDLTDEAAIVSSFDILAQTYGGLDMLVLNAGIFPSSCRIESLALDHWQKVMRINLDSNLVVMRSAYALLKYSPRGGRVVVNASKNVLAPGAGAAAYSASKAAVTQLARVAALEWGRDHIRVNQVHPDAIFDTGIWTEEVLEARAAHYGMTVQQYKTRNILGVELNSHVVGELVAEMLGPRFEKITGAQVPVDGGSDRVI
jgi:NAD(P)-dependent dehydrogenase (short-subunit alcohol dehydrogenase family)